MFGGQISILGAGAERGETEDSFPGWNLGRISPCVMTSPDPKQQSPQRETELVSGSLRSIPEKPGGLSESK